MLHLPDDRLSRRAFLRKAAIGLAGAGIGALSVGAPVLLGQLAHLRPFNGKSVEDPQPAFAMPGPFPGRVVEVNHPEAVTDKNQDQLLRDPRDDEPRHVRTDRRRPAA